MTDLTPAVPERPTRISVARYLELVVAGALSEPTVAVVPGTQGDYDAAHRSR